MKIKRFKAKDARECMRMIKETFGDHAIVLSSQTTEQGVEMVGAIDQEHQFMLEATSNDAHPIDEIKSEIAALKDVLKTFLKGAQWDSKLNRNPILAYLEKWLLELGFSPRVISHLLSDVQNVNSIESAREEIQGKIKYLMPVLEEEAIFQGGILALVGPTGVGKTTTIAKLAARFVLKFGSKYLGLITTDHYRIGSHEQLSIYGKLLDVPVYSAKNSAELRHRFHQLQDKLLVLVDTAGMSQRDERLEGHLNSLREVSNNIKLSLVLSANYHPSVISDIIKNFKKSNIQHTIITKTDEATHLMPMINLLIEEGMPISYVSNGQRVPEDIQKVDKDKLLNQGLRLKEQFEVTESL